MRSYLLALLHHTTASALHLDANSFAAGETIENLVGASEQIGTTASTTKTTPAFYRSSAEISARLTELSESHMVEKIENFMQFANSTILSANHGPDSKSKTTSPFSLVRKSDSGVTLDGIIYDNKKGIANSKNGSNNQKKRAMFIFGEHARELISPESALGFLEVLEEHSKNVGNKDSWSSSFLEADKSLNSTNILDNWEILVVPNANPLSRDKVIFDREFCLRVDQNGVDLNRNYDDHFEPMDNPGYDANSGVKPFSEPNTRILKQFMDEFKPELFLSVHSGTLALFAPYAYSTSAKPDHDGDYHDILAEIDDKVKAPFGRVAEVIGYKSPGSCIDYAFDKENVKWAFAAEIYTDKSMTPHLNEEYEVMKKREEERKKAILAQMQKNGRKVSFLKKFGKFGKSASTNSAISSDRDAVLSSFLKNLEYDGARAEEDRCFMQFNPADKSTYEKTVADWNGVYLKLLRAVEEKDAVLGK